jgi:hypothetical protein
VFNKKTMETVSEHEAATTPAIVDTGDNAHADGEDADTVGEMPLPGGNRGVRRLKSSASGARRGPQRGGVQRATSMRAGQQPPPVQPPMRPVGVGVGRSASSHSGLSRASTTGSANSSIGRPSHHSYQRGPSATLQRNESEMSLGDVSISDSVFTMDSVSLRKGQMIADPLDNGTYAGEDSFADHESFMTRDDFMPITECESPVREIKPRISGLDAVFAGKLHLGGGRGSGSGDASIVSFMTGASGLTTDYTEDSEYGCDEVRHTAE